MVRLELVSLGKRKEALWPSTTPAHRRSTAMSTTIPAEGSVRRSWIRRATADELDVVIGLVEETADWLRSMGTDQWARPWPSRAGRDSRILASLHQGKTWIGWDNGIPAATITADPEDDPYWPDEFLRDRAVYVHRLVVGRPYKGVRLGAALLDWAGRTARRDYGARWIRVSAWTTNLGLHAYYRRQGFSPCGSHPDDGYPSGARFQKPTASLPASGSTLFRES
jgi:GNAT superfamily N-acetyltransferase